MSNWIKAIFSVIIVGSLFVWSMWELMEYLHNNDYILTALSGIIVFLILCMLFSVTFALKKSFDEKKGGK